MADKKIMVDSTILIDYFRKTDKSKSILVKLSMNYDKLYISTVTEFEVINGATLAQLDFWNHMLKGFTILDFDSKAARQAAIIVQQLKTKRKSIDKPDLFIAATAVSHGLTLDTANKKHFEFIDSLNLLSE
jgi:tRNA(fMet)-specific endonuclease VapC